MMRFGRVGEHLGRLGAAEALEVDRRLEERIEGRRHEEIKVGDRGQTAQCRWWLELRILEDAAQAHVGFFAPTALRQEPAHDIIERVGLGQLRADRR